ncbi:prepilin peptidase CpaA [Natronobacillus azotifigens]|uniref:Prepilin peptidase n=1 Tax=Natronobacillus azotifigens TaxID=472978 RepID=A0A9J6RBS6_9BACI|nr:prepilin peptidase [Natronobacillus azotifigens]MCZ0703144.1 prepilin peptidase [Natronobacillus azotifigens]
MIINIVLILFLFFAFYFDVKYKQIPNKLNVLGVSIGFILFIITDGLSGFGSALLGMLVVFLIMLLLYAFKGVGAGDVKLFAAIGAITGIEMSLYILFYAVIFAGIIGVFILLFNSRLLKQVIDTFKHWFFSILLRKSKDINTDKQTMVRFPFMYAVLPAAIYVVYLYHQ